MIKKEVKKFTNEMLGLHVWSHTLYIGIMTLTYNVSNINCLKGAFFALSAYYFVVLKS